MNDTSEEMLKRKLNALTGHDINNENSKNLKRNCSTNEQYLLNDQETQQLTPPQRKKPGRKPNPASPELRKSQNRAAQRAFRERKERHLKDLENTIKSLRESQYESAVKAYREGQQLRSLIERLRNENLYLKQVSVNFEMVLNHIYGGNDTTSKIKNTILSRIQSLSPTLNFTAPLLDNQVSPIPIEMESSVTKSPPISPNLIDKSNDILINNDSFTTTSDLVVQNPDSLSESIFSENYEIFSPNVDETRDIYSDFNLNNIVLSNSEISSDLFKELDQAVRLGKLVGINDIYNSPVTPKLRYPLTNAQIQYLALPHDRRIDLIPCLHLRSRMIQYQNNYDLYDLIELLITKSKCHGDPLDPDSWELPEDFFTKYEYLVFPHCRLKSSLYQTYGRLPSDFANSYQSMLLRKINTTT
ncbi:4_t:CDS:2 [Cetraspora pellucida]|uniref:4_t:CDS:1 n=1 Tax=Cetraspora pellucida TaxID=1433469 RepID=A0A9N9AVC8_9GLOM|nr:4_t:CDS:2 [Cetraspora pellucida]